jgi:GMP synthase (glutamine-hydrolysing)
MRALVIVNCAVEDLGWYEVCLAENRVPYDVVRAYEEQLPSLDRYDLFIVGGTPDAVYRRAEYPYLEAEYDLLVDVVRSDKPCFGVCAGAQLLAAALGTDVSANAEMEIGVYNLALTPEGRDDPLLDGFPDRFESFQWHGDTFGIPSGGRLLVEGEKCRNQMFRHGNIVGVQFHLEVTRKEAARWAEAYADELATFGKTAEELIREFEGREAGMRELAFLLMKNYLASISTSP